MTEDNLPQFWPMNFILCILNTSLSLSLSEVVWCSKVTLTNLQVCTTHLYCITKFVINNLFRLKKIRDDVQLQNWGRFQPTVQTVLKKKTLGAG